jgi:drug/metabolite transporter (DMT)-like permease
VNRNRLAALALLGVGFGWGAAFVLMKDAIEQQSLYDFLATRFTIAALAMIALRPQIVRQLQVIDFRRGIPLGILLAGGYLTQTIGLELTTAAISGFVTGLYVVITPLLIWWFFRKAPARKIWLAVAFALAGLALISGANFTSLEFQSGQLWLIVCAVIFALHIIGLGVWSRGRDAYSFAFVQIAAVALVSWLFALVDGYQAPPSGDVWFALLVTALFATVGAFWAQTWAQSILDSARVALLLTSEVVFAAAIAVAVGQEQLGVGLVFGGLLMLSAMLIAEWPDRTPKANKLKSNV